MLRRRARERRIRTYVLFGAFRLQGTPDLHGDAHPLGRAHVIAIVVDRALESVAEIHGGRVAELLAGARDRSQGVAHVAGARRTMLRCDFDADELGDALPKLVDTGCGTTPDVEDLAGDLLGGRPARQQIRL